jgi:hypothetical protein
MILLLDIQHYITTTRMSSLISSEELSLAGLSPVTPGETLKFTRRVSIFAPNLVDDNVNYFQASGVRSVFTAASLAYQVIT